MPRLIDPGEGEPITLDALVDALDSTPFDVRDEESFAALGPLLARLGRNRGFLADLAIAELKARREPQSAGSGYGPQVFLLRPPNGRYVLRANFWPARDDPVTLASGPAAFFYDVAHDHNFPFLTYGYLGPGYWSDYYEYDAAGVIGVPDEPVRLRFVERSKLDPGKLMLYRARRDVHVQLPPDSFSVSLNILGADPAQPWQDQFRFDVERGTIAQGMTTTAAEALVALAAHLGGRAGLELATDLAQRHPFPRMRATAFLALASAAPDLESKAAVLEEAAASANSYVAGHARRALAAFERRWSN